MEKENKKEKNKKEEIKEKKEEEIKEENIISVEEFEARKKAKKKKTKKKFLIIGIIALVVAVAVVLFIFIGLPGIYYSKGNSNYDAKNYKMAVKYYEKLGNNYKDVDEKLNVAHFEYGKQLIKDKKYTEAVKQLEKVKDNKDLDDYLAYAKALENIEKGEYAKAIDALEKLPKFENADEELQRAYYLKGESLLKEENYEDAREAYEKSQDYKDAKDKINISDFLAADVQFNEGNLYEAKKLYEKLPKDLTYNDVKVSDKLDLLKKYDKFVKLSGTWNGKNGYFEVREIWKYNGSWENWYSSYVDKFDIKCVIDKSGDVKITGTANFYSYTNWSTLSYALNTKSVSVPIDLTVKADGSIPSKLVSKYPALVASDGTVGYVTLEYNGSQIKLNYSLNDTNYSQNFTHKFVSRITYNKVK